MKPHFLLKIAPSKIHGVGVFATKKIKKGECLFADQFPELYKVNAGEVPEDVKGRHPSVVSRGVIAYPDVRFQAYMNHDENPNYCNKTDLALRDIKKGEEVTENYHNIEGYPPKLPWVV